MRKKAYKIRLIFGLMFIVGFNIAILASGLKIGFLAPVPIVALYAFDHLTEWVRKRRAK